MQIAAAAAAGAEALQAHRWSSNGPTFTLQRYFLLLPVGAVCIKASVKHEYAMFLVTRLYRLLWYAVGLVWRLGTWLVGVRAPATLAEGFHGKRPRATVWEREREDAQGAAFGGRSGSPADRASPFAPETESAVLSLPLADGRSGNARNRPLAASTSAELMSGAEYHSKNGRYRAGTPHGDNLYPAVGGERVSSSAGADVYEEQHQRLVRLGEHELMPSAGPRWTEQASDELLDEYYTDNGSVMYPAAHTSVRYLARNGARWTTAPQRLRQFPEEHEPGTSVMGGAPSASGATILTEADNQSKGGAPESAGPSGADAGLTSSSIREAVLEALRQTQQESGKSPVSMQSDSFWHSKEPQEMRRLMRRVYMIMYAFIFSTALLLIFFFQQDGPMTSEHRILLCVVLPIYVLCFAMLHSFGDNFPANLVMLVLLSSCSWFAIGFLSAFYLHRSELAPFTTGGHAAKLSTSLGKFSR